MILKSDKEQCDEIMMRLGEYFKAEAMKEIEIIEKESKDIKIPEDLDKKMREITQKYMSEFDEI